MSAIEIKVPDIGDFKDVEVIEVLVKPGDRVQKEQSLLTVESDKASMEIPSSDAGTVKEVKLKVGDKVNQGSVVLVLEADAAAGAPAAAGDSAAAVPESRIADPDPARPPVPPSELSPAASSGASSASAPAPAAAAGPVEIKVPDIGDFDEVEVIEVLVKAGDRVEKEQSLITVESDKASMEIPSAAAGTITELKVKVGDKVKQGTLVAILQGEGGAAAPAPAPAAQAKPAAPAPAPAAAAAPSAPAPAPQAAAPAPEASASGIKPHASPSVRKFARELGVDLARVPGSGPKQRVTHEDVRSFVKQAVGAAAQPQAAAGPTGGGLQVLAWPQVDFAKFGPVESKPLSRIKKISGANLHRNWVTIPHVTNHEDADITELENFRVQVNEENAKAGVKLTMLAFLIKACVAALKKFPEFNSSLDGDNIVLKQYYHIGFAADTPNGLVVPVIRDADKKGVVELAKESAVLAAKAREGKLSPSEMQGGCFSISSLGGIGGTYFTPIINAPEVAILGVCRSAKRPVWDEAAGQFVPRLMLPLSLSWDHRVIDGASAARFNSYVAQLLADFRRAML
jgi:pyruvate dehydrogenase E2 component (dihydrolipoamide acetyltransferase)